MRCKACLPRVWGCAMSRSEEKDRPLGIAPAVPPVPPHWAPLESAAWVFSRFPNNWSPWTRRGDGAWRADPGSWGSTPAERLGSLSCPCSCPGLHPLSAVRSSLPEPKAFTPAHPHYHSHGMCHPHRTHPHSQTQPLAQPPSRPSSHSHQ